MSTHFSVSGTARSGAPVLGTLLFLLGPLLGGAWVSDASGRPSKSPAGWYASLVLPRWTPPRWAFPVAWTALYVSMGYAAWRVSAGPGSGPLTAMFVFQLALNYAWTHAFFGRHDLAWAARLAAWLCMAVTALAAAYSRVDPVAAWLTVPYAGWAAFAALLSASVRDLNSFRDARMS